LKAIRHIVLPQAIRWPSALGQRSNPGVEDSTLVYVIGVPEILRRAEYVSARTLEPFVAFGAAAAIYVALTFLTSQVLDRVERRYRLLM
jgi:polar amino acid transport system permease protein